MKHHPTLRALTAAALALPGLTPSIHVRAEQNEAAFQYSHYQEGERTLYGPQSRFRPIEVDTLQGDAHFNLSDRIKFSFNVIQDTWSGATPVATAPLDMRGNRSRAPDAVSGATPIINGQLYFDRNLNVLETDGFGTPTGKLEKRLVHTLSSASPETRKQGHFKLGYEWDEAAVDVGGGVSIEPDFESRFANLGSRLEFNQKRTTLNTSVSYTDSDINSLLDHDASPYIDTSAFDALITAAPQGGKRLKASRTNWAGSIDLTQIVTKNSLMSFGAGYNYGTGYMNNPYKVVEVAFIDPAMQVLAPPDGYFGDVRALLEQRPDVRHEFSGHLRYQQFLPVLDAALTFNYRYFHDNWGIVAHTVEANWGQNLGSGWTVTPRIRYYSQEAADFYTPYLITFQGYSGYDRNNLPNYFSSDHRLSGYGALSGGLTLSKKLAKGVSLEADIEYYTHQGDLKLGGKGEDAFADFSFFTVNGALKVDLSAASLASLAGANPQSHHSHAHHSQHHGMNAPAGLMFEHILSQTGDIMLGYRYMFSEQDGDMLRGTRFVNDAELVARGCPGTAGCRNGPDEMVMHMHMLNVMYAPTDWLNLMLMPSFVDMDMAFRELDGAPPAAPGSHQHSGGHATGGIGDTGLYAMFQLVDSRLHHLHLTIGTIAPTGDHSIRLRDNHQQIGGLIHYGMQLGSGTWDFNPSLTYSGQWNDWFWGAQANGIKRMESKNESGYRLGDMVQVSTWGGYQLMDWLSASVRGIYTRQGRIAGQFNDIHPDDSPMDHASNYGGNYWDLGLGVSAMIPSGAFAGNRLSVEWIQPIQDDVKGYQLERDGAFAASWGYAF